MAPRSWPFLVAPIDILAFWCLDQQAGVKLQQLYNNTTAYIILSVILAIILIPFSESHVRTGIWSKI